MLLCWIPEFLGVPVSVTTLEKCFICFTLVLIITWDNTHVACHDRSSINMCVPFFLKGSYQKQGEGPSTYSEGSGGGGTGRGKGRSPEREGCASVFSLRSPAWSSRGRGYANAPVSINSAAQHQASIARLCHLTFPASVRWGLSFAPVLWRRDASRPQLAELGSEIDYPPLWSLDTHHWSQHEVGKTWLWDIGI